MTPAVNKQTHWRKDEQEQKETEELQLTYSHTALDEINCKAKKNIQNLQKFLLKIKRGWALINVDV